ncbi:MAG: DUF58 domain-containing protein, partial [Pseudomonadota bacterium]
RRYAHEDDAARVDWRRSARGDALFVRETELETARNLFFWADPNPGFDWTGDPARPTKADRARVIMMAIGNLLSREGERVGVVGSGRSSGFGKRAVDRLYRQLSQPCSENLPPPRPTGAVIVASDFYDPPEAWQTRLANLASTCREGVLFAVSDPVEHEFPFQGRVRLSRPGSDQQRILGRAETLRSTYAEKLANNRANMEALAKRLGWRFLTHHTGEAALQGAGHLHQAIRELGARA